MLETQAVNCPYCGETFDTNIDLSSGNQHYIEDCYVCCRPIQFSIDVDYEGELISIRASRDDE